MAALDRVADDQRWSLRGVPLYSKRLTSWLPSQVEDILESIAWVNCITSELTTSDRE